MKIDVVCMKCRFEDVEPSITEKQIFIPKSDFIYLQVNDQNVYEFTCQKGHRNALIHQEEKFELLFESAANAISDGYLREAVSSIASSLERLYEFAIKVICIKNKIPKETIEYNWKQIGKQSERQMGAYIFLYSIEYKKKPPLLSSKQVEFRNNVIHKGYFPTYDETVTYGQETLDVMFEILYNLKETCQGAINEHTNDRMTKIAKLAYEITDQPITLSSPTIINWRLPLNDFKSTMLTDYLKELNKRKKKNTA